jgi:hypothetical protein
MTSSVVDTHGRRRGPGVTRRFLIYSTAGLLVIMAWGPRLPAAEEPGTAARLDQTRGSSADAAPPSLAELARRLQRVEEQNAALAAQNRALVQQLQAVTGRCEQLSRRLEQGEPSVGSPAAGTFVIPPPESGSPFEFARQFGPDQFPTPAPAGGSEAARGEGAGVPEPTLPDKTRGESAAAAFSRFLVGDYDDDRGMFVLVRPRDDQRVPFELRLDLFTQGRYTNFARSADSWIDSTGTRQQVRSFGSVEVTRNFIQLSGFGIDPRLQFTAFIFSSTALNDTVYLGWINYRFCEAFDLRVGNWLVPGTREWYESFRYTMGADRLMATTFFRPNISPGIWAQGQPIENVRYVAMLANSLNRFSQGVERVGAGVTFGGTVWWEPNGDFGLGPSDVENHQSLSSRIGTNLAASRETNQGFGMEGLSNPEDTILRLSDGTPLFRPGALGPGVDLHSAAVQLWTIDAAFKYRGMSLSGEYFLRWVDALKAGTGQVPFRSLFDQGGLLQAGCFLVPSKLESFARTSFVTGPFGGGNEFGGGVNWYVKGTRDWRMTFEVLRIDHSPAQNILTGYRAGETGTLFQLQWFSDF